MVMALWIVLEVWKEFERGTSTHGGMDGGNVSAERSSSERKYVDVVLSSVEAEVECDWRSMCGVLRGLMTMRPSMDRVMVSGYTGLEWMDSTIEGMG
jgi:hypothetical protein